jgi:hypothetical protein
VSRLHINWLLPFALFLVVTFALASFCSNDAWRLSDIVQVLTGAATASTLAALGYQAKQARGEARQRSQEAALRGDALHAEFHSDTMRRHRTNAYYCLRCIEADPDIGSELADLWVDVVSRFPERLSGRKAFDGQPLTAQELSDALAATIAFFVRVQQHVVIHESSFPTDDAKRQFADVFGWQIWMNRGLLDFVRQCARAKGKHPLHFPPVLEELNRCVGVPPHPGGQAQRDSADVSGAQSALPKGDSPSLEGPAAS